MLYEYEEDFRKIFKVRVEFDEEMPMSDGVMRSMPGVCASFANRKASFRSIAAPFAAILEYGVPARPGAGTK